MESSQVCRKTKLMATDRRQPSAAIWVTSLGLLTVKGIYRGFGLRIEAFMMLVSLVSYSHT